MGESFLQRKVFRRMGRLKTSNSMESGHHKMTSSTRSCSAIQEQCLSDLASGSRSSSAATNMKSSTSSSEVDNFNVSEKSTAIEQMASKELQNGSSRAMSEQETTRCSQSTSESAFSSFSQTNNNNTIITSTSASTPDNGQPCDSGGSNQTSELAACERQLPIGASKPRAQVTEQKRFKGTSKAIILLRRAASTLSHLASSDRSSLVRQIGPSGIVPNHSQHQAQFGLSTKSSSASLPQFIVPKMNTLRSPLVCRIKSIDGALMREVFINRYELGQHLIDTLKVSVGICDSKYFGLKMAKVCDDQDDLRGYWIIMGEPVFKQIKNKCDQIQIPRSGTTTDSESYQQQQTSSITCHLNPESVSSGSPSGCSTIWAVDLYLRIKFYPPNLNRVQDNFLRDYLWLQLRRDLRLGKLTSSLENLTYLMACILQYEFGNYKEQRLTDVPGLIMVPNQDLLEDKAVELWRTRLNNMQRHQAQMQFLRGAIILETYGFDYYPVKDHQRQRAYLLGFNYAGIKTIRNGRVAQHFRWHSISKISHERRMIILHVQPTENSRRKQILGFKCLSHEDCDILLMRLTEQKYFFTVDLALFDRSIRQPSGLYAASDSGELLSWPAVGENGPDLSSSAYSLSAGGQMSNYADHQPPSQIAHEQHHAQIAHSTPIDQLALGELSRNPLVDQNRVGCTWSQARPSWPNSMSRLAESVLTNSELNCASSPTNLPRTSISASIPGTSSESNNNNNHQQDHHHHHHALPRTRYDTPHDRGQWIALERSTNSHYSGNSFPTSEVCAHEAFRPDVQTGTSRSDSETCKSNKTDGFFHPNRQDLDTNARVDSVWTRISKCIRSLQSHQPSADISLQPASLHITSAGLHRIHNGTTGTISECILGSSIKYGIMIVLAHLSWKVLDGIISFIPSLFPRA